MSEQTTKPVPRNCPDCGVEPGEPHQLGCDVEQCANCGGQFISCECLDAAVPRPNRLPWTGEWPGAAECREFGWHAKFIRGQGWVPCDQGDPEARPDLNRLHYDAVWDPAQGRFMLPTG